MRIRTVLEMAVDSPRAVMTMTLAESFPDGDEVMWDDSTDSHHNTNYFDLINGVFVLGLLLCQSCSIIHCCTEGVKFWCCGPWKGVRDVKRRG